MRLESPTWLPADIDNAIQPRLYRQFFCDSNLYTISPLNGNLGIDLSVKKRVSLLLSVSLLYVPYTNFSSSPRISGQRSQVVRWKRANAKLSLKVTLAIRNIELLLFPPRPSTFYQTFSSKDNGLLRNVTEQWSRITLSGNICGTNCKSNINHCFQKTSVRFPILNQFNNCDNEAGPCTKRVSLYESMLDPWCRS